MNTNEPNAEPQNRTKPLPEATSSPSVSILQSATVLYALMIFQQLIASSTHLFAKEVVMTIAAPVVVFYRNIFSALLFSSILLVWTVLAKRSVVQPLRRVDSGDWRWFIVLGILNVPINQFLFIAGLKYTSPANASLAYALSPVIVLIIAVFLMKEKLSGNKLVGVVLACFGAVFILLEKGISINNDSMLGNGMELSASTAWAFYTVLGRKYSLKYGGVYTTALSMIIGFLIYAPLYALFPIDHISPADITPKQYGQFVYLGIVTSGLGFGLWYYLLTKLEAGKVAVFNNLQPVLTTLLTLIFYKTIPTPMFIVGACLALIGVIVTQRR